MYGGDIIRKKILRIYDWLVASDPGLTRFRVAFRAAVAMATGLGIEALLAHFLGIRGLGVVVAMLLGAVVAMVGSLALTGSNVWGQVRTAALFPVALGLGEAGGIGVGPRTDFMLAGFVVVMFIAVAIRRLGPAYFQYGFMMWMGYFFASFTHSTWLQFPFLMAAVLAATLWILLLSTTILATPPQRTLHRTMTSFWLRARRVAGALEDYMRAPIGDEGPLRLSLRLKTGQLSESALMVEGWLANPTALPVGGSALAVRRFLLEVQYLLDRMVSDASRLFDTRSDDALDLGATVAGAIAHADTQRAAQVLVHLQDLDGPGRDSAIDFSNAAAEFLALDFENEWLGDRSGMKDQGGEFSPIAPLIMESLPGSPAIAQGLPASGTPWNPLARLSLPWRQAIQVAMAGTLAILFGRWLSPVRYYWAVIAAFIMSAGTATRMETVLKGVNRVVGTLAGLVAAVVVAGWTAGHTGLIVTTIVLAVFMGIYWQRVSYVYFVFFLTIMLGELYSVLHEFSPQFMILRLEETMVGALAGLVVALVILPLSTRDTVQAARQAFLDDLQTFLVRASQVAGESQVGVELDPLVRALEDRYRRLVTVADPVTPPLTWGYRRPRIAHRLAIYAALSGYVRMVAVTLARVPHDMRPEELSQALDKLACAVGELKASRNDGAIPSIPHLEGLMQWDHVNPWAEPLIQIQRLLTDFATSKPL